MKKNLTIIFLTVFLYLLGFGIIIPIIPNLGKTFGATPVQIGFLMSIYSIMQFLCAPLWGRLSDRIGRRPVLVYCLLGEGLAYLLFAFSRSLEVLFIARGLAGIFAASLSTATAYISDISSPQNRTKNMGLIGAAFGLGFVFGPAIGGGLAKWGETLSSEMYFSTTFASLWVAGLTFATFIFAWFNLHESLAAENRNKAQHQNRLKTLFTHLSKPNLGKLMVGFGLVATAMSCMEATLILFVGEKFQWGIKESSWGFAYLGVMIVFTQGYLVRKWIPRYGEKRVLNWGLTLFMGGMLLIALSNNLTTLTIAMTVLAIGNGLTNPTFQGCMSLLSRADEQGVVMGVGHSLSALGRILGPLIGGFVFQNVSIVAPYLASSLLAGVSLVLYFQIRNQIPNQGQRV